MSNINEKLSLDFCLSFNCGHNFAPSAPVSDLVLPLLPVKGEPEQR